ncbi:hypothetical protein KDW63_15000 [Burkholderia cenocepacia]|uniref:hypothetical protein n=1 Tax=Burkholderia cenocepacia TaxID=95486 RepID=UPI001B926273|nr:hypothetical protein [Burkholderia cenocepacia]MBR8295489.1 hypothetical protein [Burkholderia cenocepacia]
MTIEWPLERERRLHPNQHSGNSEDTYEDLFLKLSLTTSIGFDAIVLRIAQLADTSFEAKTEVGDLERRANELVPELELDHAEDAGQKLFVVAIARAVLETPTLKTWAAIQQLKYNSAVLEYELPIALLVAARHSDEIRHDLVNLMRTVLHVDAAGKKPVQDTTWLARRQNMQESWPERASLEQLWWGRESDIPSFYAERPAFWILAELDTAAFVDVLSSYTDPYPIDAALFTARVSARFPTWEAVMRAAPPAFNDDNTWNGALLVPMMLVVARNAIIDALRFARSTPDKVEEAKHYVHELIEAVIGVLKARTDSSGIFARWGTWLLRMALSSDVGASPDSSSELLSPGYIDSSLVEAIGRATADWDWRPNAAGDAEHWEPWLYHALLAAFAHRSLRQAPSPTGFLDEWVLKPEDWATDRGNALRLRASLFTIVGKSIPSDGAHLLAVPILRSVAPVDEWLALWNSLSTLREIVEFGDADAPANEDWRSRSEAAGLLHLAFRIGLALLDQLALEADAREDVARNELCRLHDALASATLDMRSIDGFDRGKWALLRRHLSVRRIVWEIRADGASRTDQPLVFLPGDRPTYADYLRQVSNDVQELFTTLEMALINRADATRLREGLLAAEIHLRERIDLAERLRSIDSRRYPFNDQQLLAVSSLIA